MKICIFGAGAIGGYLGVKLAQVGADVSLVARGPHLEAMKKNDLVWNAAALLYILAFFLLINYINAKLGLVA